jgi:exosortase K
MQRVSWKRNAQLVVVLLCAAVVKLYYSTASVNQLRWILAPTTCVVEFVSGSRFEFEAYAGYINGDRSFVIAASCAGVNFLITAFLMLTLRKLWQAGTRGLAWSFIPCAALFAYFATVVANTVRISTALLVPRKVGWLNAAQLHRFEGILVYFGFLLLLLFVSERINYSPEPKGQVSRRKLGWASITGETPVPCLLRQIFFLLAIYYGTTLAIPLANGAYHRGADFWEHALFVILIPLLLLLPVATFSFFKHRRVQ